MAVKNKKPPARRTAIRGLLPTPPKVEELVVRELEGHPVTPAEKQRLMDSLKLQYFFGGKEIAYRKTARGVEVLAVGLREIGRLLRDTPVSKQKGIVIGHPEPW